MRAMKRQTINCVRQSKACKASAMSLTRICPTRSGRRKRPQRRRASPPLLQSLDGTFQQECAELKTAGADKQTLHRIAAVLSVPLLSGPQRNRLRDEYLSIAREIAPAGTQYEVAAKENNSGARHCRLARRANDQTAERLARVADGDDSRQRR